MLVLCLHICISLWWNLWNVAMLGKCYFTPSLNNKHLMFSWKACIFYNTIHFQNVSFILINRHAFNFVSTKTRGPLATTFKFTLFIYISLKLCRELALTQRSRSEHIKSTLHKQTSIFKENKKKEQTIQFYLKHTPPIAALPSVWGT